MSRRSEAQCRQLGNDHPHTLDSMSNLGVLYGHQGTYAEAVELYLEALRLLYMQQGVR